MYSRPATNLLKLFDFALRGEREDPVEDYLSSGNFIGSLIEKTLHRTLGTPFDMDAFNDSLLAKGGVVQRSLLAEDNLSPSGRRDASTLTNSFYGLLYSATELRRKIKDLE